MDALNYGNPANTPPPIEKKWTLEVRNIEDKGEGYNTLVTFLIRSDWKQIEIKSYRAVGCEEQPADYEVIDMAKAGLMEEFGDKVEFI